MNTRPSLTQSKAVQYSSPRGEGFDARIIRVLCVDDHAMVALGLQAQFAIDGRIQVVGRISSATRLVEEAKRLGVDVVILDIEMPGADAFEMANRLRQSCPEIRVVFLSAHIRDVFISACFAAGACAYFAKTDEPEHIASGILQVMRCRVGSFILGPKVREKCQPRLNEAASGTRFGRILDDDSVTRTEGRSTPIALLTSREIEILRLIGKGNSRTQIAAQLCRSAKTVDGHQDRIMKKLQIHARADLIRFAIREGLVEA